MYFDYFAKTGWLLLLAFVLDCGIINAQEAPPQEPVCWFTDQVLAPRSDWYRPDLADKRVCLVTRTFRANEAGQALGNNNQAFHPGQRVKEVLHYDNHGNITHYECKLSPLNLFKTTKKLANHFSYDSLHRLRRIYVVGDRSLLTVQDVFSSKAYARWRKRYPLFREQHHLPDKQALRELFPETWLLQSITCGYDANGRAQFPKAVVTFTSHTPAASQNPSETVTWTDTVALDLRRNWILATPDTLTGYADTAWLYHPDRWWQLHVGTTPTPGLRLHHLPPSYTYYGWQRNTTDYDFSEYPTVQAEYGFTGFFGHDGKLQLARLPGNGTVWRYTYDTLGQMKRIESFFMHLPHRYGDSLYFGGVSGVMPIADCEKRQRQTLVLPNGENAVRELQWIWDVRYEQHKQGLPKRAVVQVTMPHYTTDVSFDETLNIAQPTGPHGALVVVKNWRKVKAQLLRRQEFLARGCVPMNLIVGNLQVYHFQYEYFQ